MEKENIRNFCIIAHIDHGKSTLADRFLQITGTLDERNLREQFLDSMDLEREKGITIKLKAVRMKYEEYELNLIDTPGHADFSYEVSRSLAACEGAILVVDATSGIQAQTLSNFYKAKEAGLKIIPVVNKIDLPSSEPETTAKDLVRTFGFSEDEVILISAKTGKNVESLLAEVIMRVPCPGGKGHPFRALIFDSFFDEYLGVVAVVKVVDGGITGEALRSEKLRFLATGAKALPEEIGFFAPHKVKAEVLETGEVGYIATGLKEIKKVRVGDTIALAGEPGALPLPGYREVKPVVFASLYPIDNDKFSEFREALLKLSLSDSSLAFEPEVNSALGFGFRCGFLGLLHSEVVQERLEREYSLELISSAPSVGYRVRIFSGEVEEVKSPTSLPEISKIREILEPWILAKIFVPVSFIGSIIQLCEGHRGILKNMEYLSQENVHIDYELPLSELIRNFYDELKSVSSGFASLDYDILGFRQVDAVKLDVLVHGEVVDPLSQIVVRADAQRLGRELLIRLKEVIPKQQFEVALQAAISGKVVARETIPALRKDVLKKMSGGHRERKDKLIEKQKEGKMRLKRFGRVDITQEAFRAVLEKN